MSSLLSERPSQEEIEKIKKETEFANVSSGKEVYGVRERQREYELTREKYMEFGRRNPHGSIEIFTYKGVQYTVAGSNWEQVPNKNVYKLLVHSRPDVVLVQVRPDVVLRNFEYFPTRESPKFSSSRYFEQICRSAEEVMPSERWRVECAESLRQANMDVGLKESRKKYKAYELWERLPAEKVAVSCLYAEKHGLPVVLADLPEVPFRASLCNPATLVQLQHMLKHCSQ